MYAKLVCGGANLLKTKVMLIVCKAFSLKNLTTILAWRRSGVKYFLCAVAFFADREAAGFSMTR